MEQKVNEIHRNPRAKSNVTDSGEYPRLSCDKRTRETGVQFPVGE